MNKQLSEVESICLKAIKKGEPKTVEICFGPYLSCMPETRHTGFIKAYMLLYYFSLDLRKAYYSTLETVTPVELEDESIRLVIMMEKYVNIGALEKLRNLIKNNSTQELHPLLEAIFGSQRNSIELSGVKEHNETGSPNQQDDRKNIEDAIFIGKNIANF